MNIINAIMNLVQNPVTQLVHYYQGQNRANNAGDALEEYIKDLFANSFNMPETKTLEYINAVFSYLGNNSNPSDAMLRAGDAIEVKKIESNNAALALNSSYPKHTVLASSPMISSACKFAESRELGHINKVDPLGITYMRVRGMWGIENPWKVFNYVYTRDMSKEFTFMCIINETKWNSFDNTTELLALAQTISQLNITDIRIKNPDNPAQLNNAKLICFSK